MKFVNYDTAKYVAAETCMHLLKKWGDDVKSLPR